MVHKWKYLIKAISWRSIATGTTTMIVFALTGELDLALTAGLIETLLKIVFYYFHERVWEGRME